MTRSEDLDLATAALGVLNALSHRTLTDIDSDRHHSGRVYVRPWDLKKLLDAVDTAYPGLKDRYIEMHQKNELEERGPTHE